MLVSRSNRGPGFVEMANDSCVSECLCYSSFYYRQGFVVLWLISIISNHAMKWETKMEPWSTFSPPMSANYLIEFIFAQWSSIDMKESHIVIWLSFLIACKALWLSIYLHCCWTSHTHARSSMWTQCQLQSSMRARARSQNHLPGGLSFSLNRQRSCDRK